jgi:hypothetical protein
MIPKIEPDTVPPARPLSVTAEEGEWRAGHCGRDSMYYEERHDDGWRRIAIDGEMLTGRAHHVIYFASAEQWLRYPDWARHRRDTIIARLKSVFREPDYEYFHGTGGGTTGATVSPHPALRAIAQPVKKGEWRALLAALALLLALTGLMAWLVGTGVQNNETYWPAKRASHDRTVSRPTEPAMFWTAIGIYSGVGLASFGLAVCCLRWSLRRTGHTPS